MVYDVKSYLQMNECIDEFIETSEMEIVLNTTHGINSDNIEDELLQGTELLAAMTGKPYYIERFARQHNLTYCIIYINGKNARVLYNDIDLIIQDGVVDKNSTINDIDLVTLNIVLSNDHTDIRIIDQLLYMCKKINDGLIVMKNCNIVAYHIS